MRTRHFFPRSETRSEKQLHIALLHCWSDPPVKYYVIHARTIYSGNDKRSAHADGMATDRIPLLLGARPHHVSLSFHFALILFLSKRLLLLEALPLFSMKGKKLIEL